MLIGCLAAAGCGSNDQPESVASHAPVVSAFVSRNLALPLYPGARPTASGIYVRRRHQPEVFAAYYRSADPISKVEPFYQSRLPKGSLKMYVNEADGGTADFSFSQGRYAKQVVLASDQAGTLIQLTSSAKK